MEMRIAIHQPNFIPTYAYFQKMMEVDRFIILRHCQFEKNGYQNRFFMDDRWHTMSVNKGLEKIHQKKYVDPQNDWIKIKSNLKKYERALSKFDSCICDDLDLTNINIIVRIASSIGVKAIIDYDYHTNLTGTDRLVDICKSYKATSYLSGSSGKKYLEVQKFQENGIKVSFQSNQDYTPILKMLE